MNEEHKINPEGEPQNDSSNQGTDNSSQPTANENSAGNSERSTSETPLEDSSGLDSSSPTPADSLGLNISGINIPNSTSEVRFVMDKVAAVRNELEKVLIGQDRTVELLLVALLSNGHVLLEGVPGIAKTLLVKLTSRTLDCDFSRIQFTPDLMPSDIIGTSILNMKSSEFEFRKGPIFSNFILIDEINRAPAKTQAALFEVMEERQVTSDSTTYKLDYPLFVIATQNPVEQEGTYKLPEAQLDRFLFKIKLDYPSLEDETKILHRFRADFSQKQLNNVNTVLKVEDLKRCADVVEGLHISDDILAYIAKLVNSTRNNGDLYLGASPRASLAILKSSKALAAVRGRDFVTPEDVKAVAIPVHNHRIIISAEKELEGKTTEEVIQELSAKIEVPR